uniref:Progestin and adipoQ receptor family member VII, b n=1 Tax=Callorhinchus milii TaxID=7868 RepID=A0A4W3KF93_CALMI
MNSTLLKSRTGQIRGFLSQSPSSLSLSPSLSLSLSRAQSPSQTFPTLRPPAAPTQPIPFSSRPSSKLGKQCHVSGSLRNLQLFEYSRVPRISLSLSLCLSVSLSLSGLTSSFLSAGFCTAGFGSRSDALPCTPRVAMATVVMEQISRLFINIQQIRQLPSLLEQSAPCLPATVRDHEVPRIFREPYIHSGYRPVHHSWRYYFLTLFQRHNEAVNVWSHLIAALVVLIKLQEFSKTVDFLSDRHAWPFLILILASFNYLSCSALAHLLQARSELAHYSFFFLDYVGVAIYQYSSALVHYYYSIQEEWYHLVSSFFLPVATLLAWLSCIGCCYAKSNAQVLQPWARKLYQVVPAGLAYLLDISPVLHRIYSCHSISCTDPAVPYHRCQVLCFLVCAHFFSCPHPEKWLPGKCDIFLQGHQIFHLFMVFCTLAQLEAVHLDYKRRRHLYQAWHQHSTSAVFIGCTFIILSSISTAIYMRYRVKRKLSHKEK